MEREGLNSSFIFTHSLWYTCKNVLNFLEKANGPANLKDAQSGKYLLTNEFETGLSGLTPDEFVGLTVEDINMGLFKGGKASFVRRIKEIDKKVSSERCPVLFKEIFTTHEGYLLLRNLIKMPIISHHNKTIAVFSYDENLTSRIDLFDLFSLYERHFLPKQAIKQFLGYHAANVYFQEMPTRSEMLVLIAISLDPRYKRVAQILNLKFKTVSAHIFSLRQKLKEGIDLYVIASKIRNASRNTCTAQDWLDR